MNFVFKGSDGDIFVGTAGHCLSVDQGQFVWPVGQGPAAFDGSGERIGEYAYKSLFELDTDFALIRLDDGIPWDAEACEIGGPTGINSKTTSETVQLFHYGQGAVMADGTQPPLPARTALANGMPWRDKIFAFGAAVFGDSGAPVVDKDRRAIGVVSAGGALVLPPENPHKGTMAIMRLRAELVRAQKALGLKLRLQRSDG